MALFKVYHGDKNDLPGELKDSYGYITVNEEASAGTWTDSENQEQEYGIGEWYIDTNTKRYRIAAAELVDEEGNLYGLDDIVEKDNIVDDLVDAVYDTSSQQSRVPVSTQEQLRIGIGVAKDEDSITKAFAIVVPKSTWERDFTKLGYYKNSVTLEEELHCGGPYATTLVPPLITYNGIDEPSKNAYNHLDSVELNDNKDIITFYVKAEDISAMQSNQIDIVIIDHR